MSVNHEGTLEKIELMMAIWQKIYLMMIMVIIMIVAMIVIVVMVILKRLLLFLCHGLCLACSPYHSVSGVG